MRLLLPEGKAEASLLNALIQDQGWTDFHVGAPGSDGDFKRRLEGLEITISAGRYTSLLIVADNDGNPGRQFKKVRKQLQTARNVHVSVPSKPWSFVGTSPAVAIVMLPTAGKKGTIETLVTQAIRTIHPAEVQAAEHFIASMPNGQPNQPVPTREKAVCAAAISATCRKNPAANVQDLWQANKNYRSALGGAAFAHLVAFLKSAP